MGQLAGPSGGNSLGLAGAAGLIADAGGFIEDFATGTGVKDGFPGVFVGVPTPPLNRRVLRFLIFRSVLRSVFRILLCVNLINYK